MNKLSVIATLDEETTNAIINIQKSLGRKEEFSAHITLATYHGMAEKELILYTKSFLECHTSINIFYHGVAVVFHGVGIVALPVLSKELYQMYQEFHQEYDEYCNLHTKRGEGRWFPHSGLLYTSKQEAEKLIVKAIRLFVPISGTITGLKITKEIEAFRFKEIYKEKFLDKF